MDKYLIKEKMRKEVADYKVDVMLHLIDDYNISQVRALHLTSSYVNKLMKGSDYSALYYNSPKVIAKKIFKYYR